MEYVPFGVEALDSLLGDKVPFADVIIQLWSRSICTGLSSTCLSLARNLVASEVPVFFFTSECLDDLWLSMGFSARGSTVTDRILYVAAARYLEEVLKALIYIKKEPGVVIIDGLTLFAFHHRSYLRRTDDGLALLDKKEMSLQLKVIDRLRARSEKFSLPSVITNHAGDSYPIGSFRYGSSPDFNPVIFRNVDFSVEFRSVFSEGERYPKIVFTEHRCPSLAGIETECSLANLSRFYKERHMILPPIKKGLHSSFCRISDIS